MKTQFNNMMRPNHNQDSGHAISRIDRTLEQNWNKTIRLENKVDKLSENYTNIHIDQTINNITPISWVYADVDARVNAGGFVNTDKYKFAYQTDNQTTWMLLNITPIWVAIETDTPHRDWIDFDLTPNATHAEGRLHWSDDDGTLELGMPGGNVKLQIGQEGLIRVSNKSGSDIPNGSLVYATGSQGNKLTIDLADNSDADKIQILGMVTEDIDNDSSGFVALWGSVSGEEAQPINTSSYVEGTKLYLTTAGQWTDTHPSNAIHATIVIGIVRRSHATEGSIELQFNYFTIGNSFNGTMRQSIINKNTGSSAAVGFTAVNDAGHKSTFGLGGSNHIVFPDTTVFYGEGYGDNWYAVDGAKSHKFYTDPTDSHDNSSLGYMRLEIDSGGTLSVGATDYEDLVVSDDVIPNKKWVNDVLSKGGDLTGFEKDDGGKPPTDSVVTKSNPSRYYSYIFLLLG